MRAQRKLSGVMRMVTFLLQDNGDAPDAICLRTICRLITRVGARRKMTLHRFLGYRLIRVDRLVAKTEFCQENALILASYFAMLARALLVHTWVLYKVAFAARNLPREDV